MASTALYQIWAGTKQKELGAGSMQVLASLALGVSCLWPECCYSTIFPAQLTRYRLACLSEGHKPLA